MRFKDRQEAGQKLAEVLKKYQNKEVVVYALPRGGVPVGAEVAKILKAPLDLVIPRKIGHPDQPEYAVCAVAEDGDLLCNEEERKTLDDIWFKEAVVKERQEAKRRREAYLKNRPAISCQGKIAIVVDDGVATGLTLRLAIREVRHQKPEKVVVAVPVIPADAAEIIKKEADELVALDIPLFYLGAVGAYYEEFPQLEDEEVIKIMNNL